ncbi:MAG: DNA internalization-related competence protein ComEC/Rec2 [Burkholderiales bacterium]|nr:DNA internalization-related competence protein ComEC/Rec2 [Burkholderiales bacterium]
MRLEVLAFAAGVWLLQRAAALPAPGVLAASALAAAAAWACVRLFGGGRAFPGVVGAAAALVIGWSWAAGHAHVRLADRLDPALEGRDLVVTGVVAGLPQPFERGVRFELYVERAEPAGAPPQSGVVRSARAPRRIVLAWYNGLTPEEFQAVAPVRAGERWAFPVRLRRPHGPVNPHGFDYEAWLLERGIGATGYVAASGEPQRLAAGVARPAYLVERLRERLREKFWDALPDHRYAGVVIALAIGDQRAIDPHDWQVFTRAGVNHLMSISGLHVTMVAGLAALAVHGLWRRSARLTLRVPARKAAAAAGFAAAFAYCLLAGFAIPAQRTLYMVGVAAAALWLDRVDSASRVLCAALALVLALDPWAVNSPGFWLSFGAVAAIFYAGAGAGPGARRGARWLLAWGRMQWAVTIGLAPLMVALFKQVSLVSPIANAIAIPAVSLVVTPLALAGALWPGDALARLAHWAFEWVMAALAPLAAAPAAVWQQHAPAPWAVALAIVGAGWLLAPRGAPARTLGLLLLAPLLAVRPAPLPPGAVRVEFLDVGQGLAAVVRTAGHALLYDAGPAYGADADAGERVVVPHLRGAGIAHLDALIVTHDDADHAGGAASVRRAVEVGRVHAPLSPDHAALAGARYRLPCHAGQRWTWDGVEFAFLHPSAASYADPWLKPNARSCVLRVATPHGAVLLAGDIEAREEAALLALGAALDARVLLVPHHGSRTSSTPAFVAAVAPEHAVFAVGYRNRFGHPAGEVVARYAGARHWRTDRDGAVTFTLSDAGLAVTAERERTRRYWRAETGGAGAGEARIIGAARREAAGRQR